MALTIDIPDESELACEFSSVNGGPRVDRLQSALELAHGRHAVVDEDLGKFRKDAVVGWVHHQGRLHRLLLTAVSVA